MLTKNAVDELKKNLPELYEKIQPNGNNANTLFILKNLGHLPEGFDGDHLLPYLNDENDQIRFWAVKNLGKLSDARYLKRLYDIAITDDDSMVRREAVSSIGRMRDRQTISPLLELLDDPDPKVVLQVIRGLMIFKYNPKIQERLKDLQSHPNEMIQEVIAKELFEDENEEKPLYDHPESPEYMQNVVVHGDVQDVLKHVPDETIHLTFTSPPYYNARDYSIYISYSAYLDFLDKVFREVHRITKEGRFFIINTSPIIIPRISRAYSSKRYPIPFDIHPRLVDMGWEFIDDIVWEKPEASVKNRNAGFLQHRKPLAYKPNAVTEYLMVYRKKTTKLLDWNIRQYDDEITENSKVTGEYETTNLWKLDPTHDRVHSAVFPISLCNRVISYYSYVGDLVFDPFAGSGTLGKAAQQLGRYFFLTEKEQDYFERMKTGLSNQTLFNTKPSRFLELAQFETIATDTK